MKEYDVFVPLYHEGQPVEPGKFQAIQKRLLAEFGGCSFFPQANEGFWKMGDVSYRDEVVVYRVVGREVRSARRFMKTFKEYLKKELKQADVYIAEREVEIL